MPTDPEIDIGLAANDAELRVFADVVSKALFFTELDLDAWLEREGKGNVRVARRRGKVVGGLVLQRMGQWFGGRSVPMTGIRAVGVAPEHRASGVASALMRAALDEIHRDGIPVSTLFPATQRVYRRSGYERAGGRLRYRIPLGAIEGGDRTLEARPIERCDHAALRELYTERARCTAGNLDRSDWFWERLLDPPPWWKPLCGYVTCCEGRPQGYTLFSQKLGPFLKNELEVSDVVFLTAEAGRRLLTLFADHRSMAECVTFCGAPADPLIHLFAERHYEVAECHDWMLRLVDVRAALEARGYPAGLRAEVHLDVIDDVLAHNNRKFVLEVGDSIAQVREGGRGELRTDVRGLATIYTGHMSPLELRASEYVDGPEDALQSAAAIFAGPAPWMPDIF